MGLFDWLKQTSRHKRFDDAFALSRPALWAAIKKTIKSPLLQDKPIWLVTHFAETYTAIQNELENWQIDYEIVAQPIAPKQIERSGLLSNTSLKLVLADLIPESQPAPNVLADAPTIAMIVLERHPQIKHDERIETFCKSLPVPVECGYFLSLEDDVVKLVVNETSLKVLKQLGVNEHELITSHMVTSRLKKVLKRMSTTYVSDQPADSAKQWLEINSRPST